MTMGAARPATPPSPTGSLPPAASYAGAPPPPTPEDTSTWSADDDAAAVLMLEDVDDAASQDVTISRCLPDNAAAAAAVDVKISSCSRDDDVTVSEVKMPSCSMSDHAATSTLENPSTFLYDDTAVPEMTMSSCTTEIARGIHLFNVFRYTLARDSTAVGEFVRSGEFCIGDLKWVVRFYPSGSEAATGEQPHRHVSVYLELLTPMMENVRVRFDLSVINSFGKMISLFHEDDNTTTKRSSQWRCGVFSTVVSGDDANLPPHHPPRCWGIPSFDATKLETLANIKDNCLTIRCDMKVIKPPYMSETKPLQLIEPPPPCLSKDLGKLLKTKDGADVTVLVRGEAFSAHKAVLMARSPVLWSKLRDSSSSSSSSLSSSPYTISIHDVEPAVFKDMLSFIYTDNFPAPVTATTTAAGNDKQQRIPQLLVAAKRYGVERLMRMCESVLCGCLTKATLAAVKAFAEQHGCEKLAAACEEFYLACYPKPTTPAKRVGTIDSSVNPSTSPKRQKTS